MLKDIADAFGLAEESLEPIEEGDDEQPNKTERCQSCDDWARKCAELELALAECRRELELHRRQIEALLRC